MLHIDTRELHPGLIMSACRLSRAKEREMKEERRRRRSRRRRRRRRSGKGEVKGREEQQAVQPRVPGGAQMFIPVDLSSPLAPSECPSSCSPICPLHLRFLRRRSAPSAIQCCGALHLRYACSCCSDALTVASQSSPFSPTDGNMTGSIAQRKVPDMDPRFFLHIIF